MSAMGNEDAASFTHSGGPSQTLAPPTDALYEEQQRRRRYGDGRPGFEASETGFSPAAAHGGPEESNAYRPSPSYDGSPLTSGADGVLRQQSQYSKSGSYRTEGAYHTPSTFAEDEHVGFPSGAM
ncbi:hypothetical protein CTRI78_v011221 [Colletotrichum trifolii]|uniref:Uncharacterized protein n=1 Tax=Colletotrichum trifolii TaxID=5466 RepID=A0A4R8QR75_COLTR|nr:hypothetical protein CTRI78_v011221 [Colletotrichum trifolii]